MTEERRPFINEAQQPDPNPPPHVPGAGSLGSRRAASVNIREGWRRLSVVVGAVSCLVLLAQGLSELPDWAMKRATERYERELTDGVEDSVEVEGRDGTRVKVGNARFAVEIERRHLYTHAAAPTALSGMVMPSFASCACSAATTVFMPP